MKLLTKLEKEALRNPNRFSGNARSKAVFNAKRKAKESLKDLTCLAGPNGLPGRVKWEVFGSDGMGDFVEAVLTLNVNRRTCRLPPSLGRKRPRDPKWTKNQGRYIQMGRWVKIGGRMRDLGGAPIRSKECFGWGEVAYGMLKAVHASLLQVCPSKNKLAVWLTKDGKTIRLRGSTYRLHAKKVERYDFQRKEPVEAEEQWIHLPIGSKNPETIAVIVMEDKDTLR